MDVHAGRLPAAGAGGVARVRLIDDRGGRRAPGFVQLTADRPGRLAADVRVDAPAISPSPSASTTAGRRPPTAVRSSSSASKATSSAVRVEPGVGQVELRFTPRSFRNGVIVSAIGAMLLAGALLVWRP